MHEIFQELHEALKSHPGKLRGYDGIYQFLVTGNGGGAYFFQVSGGLVELKIGENERPNITIIVSEKDLIEIYDGKLDGMKAMMRGKVQVKGDLPLTVKLPALWRYLMEARPKKT